MCPLCITSIYHKDAAEHLKNDHSAREKEQLVRDPKFLERQIETMLEIVNSKKA